MREAEDHDTGFVCKGCGGWFADRDVKEWDTKWAEPDEDGERWLTEPIHKCPIAAPKPGLLCSTAAAITTWTTTRIAVFISCSPLPGIPPL
jgi:hypothetical protein